MVARKAFYTFLCNPNGNRYTLYLYWNDDRWNWNANWLDNDRNVNNPSVVLATHFISPLYLMEEFSLLAFVLKVVHASRRAFCLSHLRAPIMQYIFYYLKILFPRVS